MSDRKDRFADPGFGVLRPWYIIIFTTHIHCNTLTKRVCVLNDVRLGYLMAYRI